MIVHSNLVGLDKPVVSICRLPDVRFGSWLVLFSFGIISKRFIQLSYRRGIGFCNPITDLAQRRAIKRCFIQRQQVCITQPTKRCVSRTTACNFSFPAFSHTLES